MVTDKALLFILIQYTKIKLSVQTSNVTNTIKGTVPNFFLVVKQYKQY